MMFRKVLQTAGLIALTGAGSVNAGVLVTTWQYQVESYFSAATYSGDGGTAAGVGVTTLQWSNTDNPKSSLVIGNNPTPAGAKVDTWLGVSPPQVAPYLGVSNTLTHNNNVIFGGSLTSATLRATVKLTPDTPPGSPLSPDEVLSFNISFLETSNDSSCESPSPPGNPCNDIFVLTGGLLNDTFVYDELTYFVNIFPVSGGVLSQLDLGACTAVGAPPGCIGFTTEEGKSTTLGFGFTISTERQEIPVPEPGILTLLGASLFGLAAFRRRRVR